MVKIIWIILISFKKSITFAPDKPIINKIMDDYPADNYDL